MRYYFGLQYKMLNRHFTDNGFHFLVGTVLMIGIFVGLSTLLFSKTAWASYMYVIIALFFVLKMGETKRNQFIRLLFPGRRFYQVRLLENGLVIFPFLIFLVLHRSYLPAFMLCLLSILLAVFGWKHSVSRSIPTPFYKRPFEFIVGFRNTWLLLFLAYGLLCLAVSVGNFNLGIFSLLLVFMIACAYYFQPEDRFFVWVFNLTPTKFLLGKIRIALWFSTQLTLPAVAILIFFFPGDIGLILGFHLLGYVYLATIVLAKYAAFPDAITLPQIILVIASIFFPPLLLVTIPVFYSQARDRLQTLLA